jgi:hypothetical protein
MADLETLSTRQHALFMSIGAVAFDPRGSRVNRDPGNVFYQNVDIVSAQRAGLHVDGETIVWWFKQSDAARSAFKDPAPRPIDEVLESFARWYKQHTDRSSFVWSHGATFDIPILTEAFQRVGMKAPWFYSRVHDTRTLFDLVGVKLPPADLRAGGHNALHDAIAQAEHVQLCTKRIFALAGAIPQQSEGDPRDEAVEPVVDSDAADGASADAEIVI